MQDNSKFAALESREEPRLGALYKLPRELRDEICDMCYKEKQYTRMLSHQIPKEFEDDRDHTEPRTVHFNFHTPQLQTRLVSRDFKSEHDSRAPTNTIMFDGCDAQHLHVQARRRR